MITGWLAYCIVVGSLLCLAGAALDRWLTASRCAARWVWALVILATLAIPAVALLRQQRTPAPAPYAVDIGPREYTDRLISLFGVTRPDSIAHAASLIRPRMREFAAADRIVFLVALAAMIVAFARILLDSALLHRGRRHWTARRVDEHEVLVSRDFGPALVGLLQYAVVLPEWTLSLPPRDRALVLRHEDEHARANDVRLTTAALFAVLCMPWNPALWYALRRLRQAIEVDCDRRVLAMHGDVETYGRLLVDMAGRAKGRAFAVAGFSERAARVVRRIRAMTAPAQRFTAIRFAANAALAVLLVGSSVAMLPPSPPAAQLSIATEPAVLLARNAGDSIAEGRPPRIVGAASGLPARFSVLAPAAGVDAVAPPVAQCAIRLRDDRDGTTLVNRTTSGRTVSVTQRNDTAWTRIEQVAYYAPSPENRYGLRDGQLLRVGCGGYTRIRVAGRDVQLVAPASMTAELSAARENLIDRLKSQLQLDPEAVEVRPSFAHVVIADSALAHAKGDTAWHLLRAIGRTATAAGLAPDTIVLTMHDHYAQAMSIVLYPKHHP